MIKARRSTKGLLMLAVAIAVIIVGVAGFVIFHPLFFFVVVAGGFLTWAVVKYGDLEYEYTYIEGQLDIDRIYGKSRRKSMAKIDMEDLLLIAPEGSGELSSYERDPNVKRLDCSSLMPDHKKYKAVYKADKTTVIVTFEPDQNILDKIRVRNARKVIL